MHLLIPNNPTNAWLRISMRKFNRRKIYLHPRKSDISTYCYDREFDRIDDDWKWRVFVFNLIVLTNNLMGLITINQNIILFSNTQLTHWGRVTHICVGKLTIIGSDNGLSPDRCQAIIWTNSGLLLIGPLATNFSEILIEILTFSFKKMRLKVSSAKRRPFCLGLNVLKQQNGCNAFWYQGILCTCI